MTGGTSSRRRASAGPRRPETAAVMDTSVREQARPAEGRPNELVESRARSRDRMKGRLLHHRRRERDP